MVKTGKSRCVTCPHCDAMAVTYSSRRLSALVSEKYYACSDVECGHIFVVSIGVVRSIAPSLKPNVEVNIPLVQRRANDIVVGTPAPNQGGDTTPGIRPLHGTPEHAAADARSPRGPH